MTSLGRALLVAFLALASACGSGAAKQPSVDSSSDGARDAAPPEAGAPDAAPTPDGDAASPEMDAGDADAEGAADTGADALRGAPYLARAVTVGRYHVCALLDDGNVKCWGLNTYGQLGLGDTTFRGAVAAQMGDALPTVDLGTGRTALQIDAGVYSTCAVLDDHSVKCWGLQMGAAADFQLGDLPGEMGDALPRLDLGPGRAAKRVAVGHHRACVLRDDDSLRCFAMGAAGAIDAVLPAGRRIVDLTGADGIGLLFDDGSVSEAMPAEGVTPAQLLLPLALGTARRARSIAGADVRGLCAALVGGGVICRGSVTPDELALGDFSGLAIMELRYPCAARTDGEVRCFNVGGNGTWAEFIAKSTVRVRLDAPVVALVGGGQDFACALLGNGAVRCWGDTAGVDPWTGGTFPEGTAGTRWLPIDLGTRR